MVVCFVVIIWVVIVVVIDSVGDNFYCCCLYFNVFCWLIFEEWYVFNVIIGGCLIVFKFIGMLLKFVIFL